MRFKCFMQQTNSFISFLIKTVRKINYLHFPYHILNKRFTCRSFLENIQYYFKRPQNAAPLKDEAVGLLWVITTHLN